MNRKQRRIQRRRVRRIGVVVASLALLGATAGLGGAAVAGGTPGEVGNKDGTITNKTVFIEGFGVYRTHFSTINGEPAQENYTAVTQGAGATTLAYHGCFITSNGRTDENNTPGIEYQFGC